MGFRAGWSITVHRPLVVRHEDQKFVRASLEKILHDVSDVWVTTPALEGHLQRPIFAIPEKHALPLDPFAIIGPPRDYHGPGTEATGSEVNRRGEYDMRSSEALATSPHVVLWAGVVRPSYASIL